MMNHWYLSLRDQELADMRIGNIKPLGDGYSVGFFIINTTDAEKNKERFCFTLYKAFAENLRIKEKIFEEIEKEIFEEIFKPEKKTIEKILEEELAVPGNRKIRIEFKDSSLEVTIFGRPVEEGQNGRIENLSFNPDTIPGKIGIDGNIDWRKIGKYPSVKSNQKLLDVLFAKKGTAGFDFHGQMIPVIKETSNYNLTCGGTFQKTLYDEVGKTEIGYSVFSKEEGVLVIEKDKRNLLCSITVVKELIVREDVTMKKVGNLDETTGGENFFLVPLKIFACLYNGLVLRGEKEIQLKESRGGIIESKEKITVGSASEGTRISGEKIVLIGMLRNSTVIAKEKIIITSEITTSSLTAPVIIIGGKNKKSILNSNSFGNIFLIKNTTFSGENVFSIGADLFLKKKEKELLLEENRGLIKKFEEKQEIQKIFLKLQRIILKIKGKIDLSSPDQKEFEGFPRSVVRITKNLTKLDSFGVISSEAFKAKEALELLTEKNNILKNLQRKEEEIKRGLEKLEKEIFQINFEASGFLKKGSKIIILFGRKRFEFSSDEFCTTFLAISFRLDGNKKEVITNDNPQIRVVSSLEK